jgi:hypothetical protein
MGTAPLPWNQSPCTVLRDARSGHDAVAAVCRASSGCCQPAPRGEAQLPSLSAEKRRGSTQPLTLSSVTRRQPPRVVPSMARASGLMTPTTCPSRLASLRTFTQVRATAGCHVVGSTASAGSAGPVDALGVAGSRVCTTGSGSPAKDGLVTPEATATRSAAGAVTPTVVAGARPPCVPPPSEAPIQSVAATPAAAAPRRLQVRAETAGTSPHVSHDRSARCMRPQPAHRRSATRRPAASKTSSEFEQRGHVEAADSAFAPQAWQRRYPIRIEPV